MVPIASPRIAHRRLEATRRRCTRAARAGDVDQERHPEARFAAGEVEPGRSYADHLPARPIDLDRAANDVRIRTKSIPPQRVTDDHYRAGTRPVFSVREESPLHRANAKHVEEPGA